MIRSGGSAGATTGVDGGGTGHSVPQVTPVGGRYTLGVTDLTARENTR